jgi:hypothetical protein
MFNLKSFLILATAAASLSLAAPAFADSVSITLLNPTQTIAPGQTDTFNVLITTPVGNTGDIYLNSDSVNIANADMSITIDDSAFLSLPYPLTPGSSFTGALFSITDTGMLNESYSGTFAIFGGAASDGSKDTLLTTLTFGSPVAVSVTPEPSSLLLLATGAMACGVLARRRMKEAASNA